MTAEYPFDGCCPHVFNAHTRNHCVVCDCTKLPARIDMAPLPEPSPTVDGDVLRSCGQCGALLLDENREKHIDWHQRELDSRADILTTLAKLTHDLKIGDQP